MMNKRQSWNIVTMFCILIFGFTIATVLCPKSEYSETENRTLAQRPGITFSSLLSGDFESDYEDYLTDQFVARDGWIGLKTGVERLLQKRESKDIYFAADDYLIEKHTGAFTSDTASENIQYLQKFGEIYREQFGPEHMTFMVIPNAVDILRDKLPPYAAPCDEETYLAEIQSAVPEGTWFKASEVLQAHSEEELYYRTDHHWKTLAAFYVYQEWAKEHGFEVPSQEDFEIETVTDSFLGTIQSKLGIETKADSIELYHPVEDIFYTVRKNGAEEITYSIYDRNALDTKSKYDIFFGGNYGMVQIQTKAGTGRSLLLIKDSYAHCFAPFLLSEFDEIHMVDIRYYNQKLSELVEENHYTDLLFLYNAAGFAEDSSLSKLMF